MPREMEGALIEVLYIWFKVPMRTSNLASIKASLKPLQLQSFGTLNVDLQNDSFSKVFFEEQTSGCVDSAAAGGF